MDKTLRSILWVLVLLVVLSSFSTAWFFVAKEGLYSDYVKLEDLFKLSVNKLNNKVASLTKENTTLSSRLKAIEKDMFALERKNSDISVKYEALLSEREDLNMELARVKRGKFFLERRLKDVESGAVIAQVIRDKSVLETEIKKLNEAILPRDSTINNLRKRNTDLEIQITKLIRGQDEIADIKLENQLLKDKVAQIDKNFEIINNLGDEKKDMQMVIASLKKDLADKNAEVYRLKTVFEEKDRLAGEKTNLDIRISELKRDLDYKNREIDKLKIALLEERKNAEARAEAYHSPQEVQLPPIVVNRGGDMGADKLRGRIVTVNREHGFVVIDIGKDSGIDVGSGFDVYRSGDRIASIEVIQARERIAAADIKELEAGYKIEMNDVVVKQ